MEQTLLFSEFILKIVHSEKFSLLCPLCAKADISTHHLNTHKYTCFNNHTKRDLGRYFCFITAQTKSRHKNCPNFMVTWFRFPLKAQLFSSGCDDFSFGLFCLHLLKSTIVLFHRGWCDFFVSAFSRIKSFPCVYPRVFSVGQVAEILR